MVFRKLALGAALVIAAPAAADVVGKISTDWTGNDIVVEAIQDPKVGGVTCYLTYFERSLIDRVRQGNWFEDPSNSSIACRQTGTLSIGDIELGRKGEEVFSERRSLIFKHLVIRRIYDKENKTLVYVSHTKQVKGGSAKMAVSAVPLNSQQVTWAKGEPK